jgi:hypothetical protein
MNKYPFELSLYDENDEIVAIQIPSGIVPAAGTQLILHQLAGSGEFCWEVTGVAQVHFADPASGAALNGAPQAVELRVKPGKGIHDS